MTVTVKADVGGASGQLLVGGVPAFGFNSGGVDKVQDASITEAKLATGAKPIGSGQTWQNLLASRAFDVTYTNTTGRTICVHVSAVVGAGTQPLVLTTGGMGLRGSAVTVTNHASITVLIPAGGTYVVSSGGMSSLMSWHELR